jgi:hypothetical protein
MLNINYVTIYCFAIMKLSENNKIGQYEIETTREKY